MNIKLNRYQKVLVALTIILCLPVPILRSFVVGMLVAKVLFIATDIVVKFSVKVLPKNS